MVAISIILAILTLVAVDAALQRMNGTGKKASTQPLPPSPRGR